MCADRGTSAFVSTWRRRCPNGVQSMQSALPPGPLLDFFNQSFAPKQWYDALPIRPLTELVAKLERRTWEDSIHARARDFAQREAGLMRRVRMRVSSPEKIVEELERAALDNFNFGQSELVEVGPGLAKVAFHEVPQPLGSWFMPTMAGYAGVLIEKAGGSQPQCGGRLIPKGRRDKIGLVDVRINLSWS